MNDLSPYLTVPQPLRLTVEEFLRLDASGVLDRFAKTELIEGEVLVVNAQHRPHMFVKNELAFRLRVALEAIGSPLYAASEGSVALTGDSLPEPDITLTSQPRGEGPIPSASVALIVEVSVSTLPFDLERKSALYASAGVPEYWVADVGDRRIHRQHVPRDGRYHEISLVPFGEPIAAATIAGLTIATTGL